MALNSDSKSVAIGIALGALLELPTLVAAVASGGAGHGQYIAARMLFPFPMLMTLIEGEIGPLSIIAALLQFPAYGGLIGWAAARRTYFPVKFVAALHILAIVICFSGALRIFS